MTLSRQPQLQPKSKMKPFSVFIIRQEKPIDGTNGHHVMPFDTQGDAIDYAKCEMENGYERAIVIQWTRKGQRRIATLTA